MSIRRRKELEQTVAFMEHGRPDGTTLYAHDRWYIVRTWTMKEVEYGARLLLMGAGVYCPVRAQRKKVGRGLRLRHVSTQSAVFTSYVFVALGRLSWLDLFDSGYIHGVICHGDRPAAIHPRQVAAIASRERHGAYRSIDAADGPGFRAGDNVRVDEGPLRGLRFRAEKVSGGLVSVVWDAVGKKNFVELRVDSVSKVD